MFSYGRISALSMVVVSAAALSLGVASAATADSLPYTDQAANGGLGLCSPTGQPVTSGNINAAPFITAAIGAAPPPASYKVQGAKGTLYAYQPRQGVDPGEWSGEILTGSSTYSDPDHPAAKGTVKDNSLAYVISALPPVWDGLYELRLTYSGPNRPASGYAAASIRVTGDTWQLVDGTTPSCSETVTSGEEGIPGFITASNSPAAVPAYINGSPNPKAFPHGVPTNSIAPFIDPDDAQATPSVNPTPAASGSPVTSPTASTATSSSQSAPSAGQSDDASNHQVATKIASQHSSLGAGIWIVIGLAALAVIGALVFLRIRRRTPSV